METGGQTGGRRQNRWEMAAQLIDPLASAEERRPSGRGPVSTWQNESVHSVKQVLPWATEKAAPHFGKPRGLAPVSWKRSKIMHLISMKRH